ncbi:MAG: hypothetical protein RR537_04965 [Longicatena sp.]
MVKKVVQNKKGKTNPNDSLAGIHIYKDAHDRPVYYDVFSHNGYVINNIQNYKNYSSRFVVGLLLGILCYSFKLGLILSVIIALGAYIFLEVKFRMFLNKQTMMPNFKPKARPSRLETAANDEVNKIYMKIVAYFLMSVLIIILPFTEPSQYEMYMKVLCILIGIISAGIAIFQIRVLFYKKANTSSTK